MRNRKRRGRGEGAIYQLPDGTWAAAVEAGVHPATGKRRRKVIKRRTKAEVQERLDELRQQRAESREIAERMPLKTFLVKPRVDPATYALHKQRIEKFIKPYLGHVPPAGLTEFMVKQWLDDLEKAGVSADMRNKVGQLLRRALRHAVKREYARENVAAEVELPRVCTEEMHPLTEEEARRFLAAAATARLYPLYLLALDSGMRQGELIALEWSDIDFEAGTVAVMRTAKTAVGGGVRVKEVKTKASRRRIRLARQTLDELRRWRLRTPGRLVFPTAGRGPTKGKGGYLHKGNLRTVFLRVLRRGKLPAIRFHDLRHTSATLLLLKTKNVKAVSCRLGHEDIRVTLDTYVHYLPVMEEELVAAMEGMLSAADRREACQELIA
jgi:integrase